MAGDWIKVEKSTPNKPEVLAMSASLDIDPDMCFGKLVRVWSWFDDHTVDGNATGNGLSVTEALLDRLVGVTGFGHAMAAVGWLVRSDNGLQMPHFDYHTSESAKQRALTAKRVAKHKEKAGHKSNATSVTSGVTSALPREEKRREEDKEHTHQRGDWSHLAQIVQDAIARWNRYWTETHGSGKPDSPTRIESMLTTAKSAGWSDEQIAESVVVSIGWNAKSWRDPEADHDKATKARINGRQGRAVAFHQPGANFDPNRQPTALDPTIGSMD